MRLRRGGGRWRPRRILLTAGLVLLAMFGAAYSFLVYHSFGSPPPLALGTAPPAQLPRNADGSWAAHSGVTRVNATVHGGWVTQLQLRTHSTRASPPAPVELAHAGDSSAVAALVASGRTQLRVEIRRAGVGLTLACAACPGGPLLIPLQRQQKAAATTLGASGITARHGSVVVRSSN